MSFPSDSFFTSSTFLDPQQGYGGVLANYSSITQNSGTTDVSLLEITPYLADGTANAQGGVQLNGILNTSGKLTVANTIQINPQVGGARSDLDVAGGDINVGNGNLNIVAGNVALTGGNIKASAGFSSVLNQTPTIYVCGKWSNTAAIIVPANGFIEQQNVPIQDFSTGAAITFPNNLWTVIMTTSNPDVVVNFTGAVNTSSFNMYIANLSTSQITLAINNNFEYIAMGN